MAQSRKADVLLGKGNPNNEHVDVTPGYSGRADPLNALGSVAAYLSNGFLFLTNDKSERLSERLDTAQNPW
jgi:hypothetical protein